MKKDSKKRTIIEVSSDVILGCAVATTMNYMILPHYIETIETGEPIGMQQYHFGMSQQALLGSIVSEDGLTNDLNV